MVQSNTTERLHHHQDAGSPATRSSPGSPAAAKKPRIEAPSPLPTFKVRKEKLGDRITALQQLTDTASVLHEAIEYIKFLHDQVASLSSPYLRCGRPMQLQHQQGSHKANDNGEGTQDLRSRGLCLVSVASTYTVASETATEFWHPTFGGTFR
uniref:BHLH domain-containing protein n=1 Tax=Oryza punctata TaxID=4537 RepID=A0A0E0L4C6_ORYPU